MLANLDFKKLFLIDGLGAVITVVLLSQVLTRFESLFGMPKEILVILASIACCFAIYSFLCYLLLKENWKPYLKGIATANTSYCIITAVLASYFYESLTWLGISYFIGEIIIILILVRLELMFANKQTNT